MGLNKLNERGISLFGEYLRKGAVGPAPTQLLHDPATSESVSSKIEPPTDIGIFSDRYVFGNRLNSLLSDLDSSDIANDKGLWSALALLWFESLCPPKPSGSRNLKAEYLYILSSDYRHYYRHLVRSPWQLVRDHAQNAKFLLIAPRNNKYPLAIHGEILEQFGGRQQVLASQEIIRAANNLYFDPTTNRPRKGAAGSGKGSARRFGMVFRQFDLTYDPACMPPDTLKELLPSEFDRWKTA
ncbi:MAG: hypothetical protein GY748_12735 [Planctomycetaceae bacterium]|nr:hypothetical protein [Planctomycetaceae bacterium]